MGWSCSAYAGKTMEQLSDACYKQTKSSNTYVHRGRKYFFEPSHKEHADGAITGTISRLNARGYVDAESSFRINGDGTIARGTGLKELLKQGKKPAKKSSVTKNPRSKKNR